MTVQFPRLLVAAPASGSGKTTVTCALLRALAGHGRRAAAFKCGPDYIDPMFHRESVGAAYSANLDLFLSDGDTARRLLAKGAEHADIALIEGAMGYYDGIAVSSDASAYAVARATGAPVLLVVSCRGMAASVAAQVRGFTGYRPDANIAAVLLNHLSAARYPEVKALVERECGVPVAGYLPPMPGCAFESRHLGLVTAGEAAELGRKLDELAGARPLVAHGRGGAAAAGPPVTRSTSARRGSPERATILAQVRAGTPVTAASAGAWTSMCWCAARGPVPPWPFAWLPSGRCAARRGRSTSTG